MALRMGDIMVNVRAQDFASRTLRRVSGEMAGLSRTQMLAFRGQEVAFQRQSALSKVAIAQSDLRRLAYVKEARHLSALTAATGRYAAASKALNAALPRVRAGGVAAGAGGGMMMTGGRFAPIPPQARAQIAAARTELLAAERGLRQFGLTGKDVNQVIRETGKHSGILGDRLSRMEARIGTFSTGMQRAFRSTSAFGQAQFAANQRLATAYNNLSRADQAQIAFNQTLRNMPVERLDNVAHAISGIGRTLQLFGAIGTIAFGASARSAAKFSTQVSLAATQARDMGAPFEQIRQRSDEIRNGFSKAGVEIDGILGLMQKFPATSEQMSDAAYEVFSSMQLQEKGVTNMAAGLHLLETANKLAVAGGIDLEEATDAMIVTLNNFDPALENVNAQMDTMFDIVRFGKMHVSDFGKMMIPLAPAAAAVGNSLEDIGGAMAFLSERMASPERVATGLARLIEALRHPDIVKGLKKFGVEALNLTTGKLRPLPKLLKDIADRFPGLRTGALDAATWFRTMSSVGRGGGRGREWTIQGRRVFVPLIKQIDEYLVRQGQVLQNTDEFQRALKAQMETPGVQWAIFVNQLKALVLVIGQEVIPVFAKIGGHIERLVDWFERLDPAVREQIVQWGAWIAVGTLLAGVAAAVFGSFLAFEAMLRRLALGGAAASASWGTLAIVLRRIAAIGIIFLAINLVRGGEMGLWHLLAAAGFGAMLGLKFGPAGAVVGAITVPIVLKMMEQQTPFEQAFREYEQQFKSKFGGLRSKLFDLGILPVDIDIDKENFQRQWNVLMRTVEKKPMTPGLLRALEEVDPQIRKLFEKYVGETKKAENSTESLLSSIKNLEKRKVIEGMLAEGKANADELQKLYDAMNEGADSAAAKQKELAKVTKDAHKQAIDSLRGLYQQLQGVNEQAMGQLFKGPWLTSETFNLAKEWGIQPRIEDMLTDLRAQNAAFAKWRKGLDALFKRGLPKELIDELRKMGPEEGQAFVDNLLKAKPGQVQAVIRQWKIRNKQIQEATKLDFTREIEAFRKAGTDMGEAIINGFQDVQVGAWFDSWVSDKFPGIIGAAVDTAVQSWKDSQPPGTTPGGIKPTVKPPPTAGSNTTNTRVDNSKKAEVNINAGSYQTPDTQERIRQSAFEAEQRLKRILGFST